MKAGIFWGCAAATAAWKLAQLRTFKSSLSTPLSPESAHTHPPSDEYMSIVRRAEACVGWRWVVL